MTTSYSMTMMRRQARSRGFLALGLTSALLLVGSSAQAQTTDSLSVTAGERSVENRDIVATLSGGLSDPIASSPRWYNLQLRATYLGAGGLLLAEDYLSPLSYGGYTISLQHERARHLYRTPSEEDASLWQRIKGTAPRTADPRWLWHQFFAADYGSTTNPAGNATIMRLQARYETAWLYQLYQGQWGRLRLGPGLAIGVGGLYSTRNGNNPATFKQDNSLTLALSYDYRLPSPSFPIQLRLMSRMDLLGTQFSQRYGESYYEMLYVSEALDHRFALVHLGNQLSQQFRASIDIPIWDRAIVSLSYRFQHRGWEVNGLRSRQTEHVAGIGFVQYIEPRGGRQTLRHGTDRQPLPL